MVGKDIGIRSEDGEDFMAYLALPDGGKGPGIVVIQEIFGVNQVMRDLCDGFAEEGYVAICPDLFWRQEPNVQLTDQTEEEWQRAFALMQGFDIDKGVEDLTTTLTHLRGHEACTGKAGSVGYCLGGHLAYLMATRTDSDANVGYYGVNIDQKLDEASNIKKPLLLHIAEEDKFVPQSAQTAIHACLADNPLATLHTYPRVDHAFARLGGQTYNAEAAKLANRRTAEFFARHLR